MVMTNSNFTKGAVELAESTGVKLWDRVPLRKARGSRILFIFILLVVAAAAAYYTLQSVG